MGNQRLLILPASAGTEFLCLKQRWSVGATKRTSVLELNDKPRASSNDITKFAVILFRVSASLQESAVGLV